MSTLGISIAGDYDGEYQNGRFHGKGTYKFNGTVYEGTFVDGQFHGEGKLIVKGGVYQGYWNQGKLVEGGFTFDDGLPHLKVGYKFWDYCSPYDPRFYSEIKSDLKNGDPLRDIAAHQYADQLPKDCYDVGDGYYDVKKHTVYDYVTGEEIRMPNNDEITWILANCRVGK